MFRLPGPVVVSHSFLKRILKVVAPSVVLIVILVLMLHSDKESKKDSSRIPQQRRIQEAFRPPFIPDGSLLLNVRATNASSSLSGRGFLSDGRNYAAARLAAMRNSLPNLIYDSNYSLPVIRVPNQGLGVPVYLPYKPNTVIENQESAQMTALAMKERGMRLTDEQEEIIKNIDKETKQQLREKISSIRQQQEKSYFHQMRSRGQIQLNPSGGERILSSPYLPVRFPSSLKKVRPEDWEGDYRIYLNLTHFPWARTATCKEYKTTFAPPGSLATAALASFPSSGNTWVRYLLESASGIFTGSLYDDSSLTRKGMYGEGVVFDSGMTILQKTHGYTTGDAMQLPHSERIRKNHMSELNNQGVIIVRNPFKALVSHRHLDVGGHTGYAPKSHFVGEGWQQFVTLKLRLWKEFYIDWLQAARPKDLHIVIYEDLKSDPVMVVRNILKFLHLPVDEKRLDCLAAYPDGMFKRKPSKNLPLNLNPYSQDLKDMIYEAIDEVNEVLLFRDKLPLPTQRYEMYNDTEAADRRRKNKKSDSSERQNTLTLS